MLCQGRYKAAEMMTRRELVACKKRLGGNHPLTLTSVSNLAVTLGYQGKYGESEKLHRQVLAAREKNFGNEHFDTLHNINGFAVTLHAQGRYEESEAASSARENFWREASRYIEEYEGLSCNATISRKIRGV